MTKTESLQVELLAHLAVSPCGTADVPTLVFLADRDDEVSVLDAMELLVGDGEVEKVGVAFRISDKGRARLNGGRS